MLNGCILLKIDTDTSRKDPIKDPKIEFRTRKRPEKRIPKRNPFLFGFYCLMTGSFFYLLHQSIYK